ncbi:MAG: DMT family transporter [Promethearchaeota archaeon]
MHDSDRNRGLLGATFNYLFIGLSFLFMKTSLTFAPTFVVLTLRFVISFTILTIIILFTKGFQKVKFALGHHPLQIFLFAIFQPIIFFTFQALALIQIDTSEAGLISSISPALVAILGFIFLQETLSRKKIIGLLLTLGGLVVIYILKGAFSSPSNPWGVVFILVATFSASIYQIIGRNLAQKYDPMTLAYIRIGIGTALFPLLGLVMGDWNGFSPSNLENPSPFIWSILFLAVFTTVGTSLLTIYSLKRLKAAEQGIFASLATVIAIFAGILFLDEIFQWYELVGSIIVIMGVVLMSFANSFPEKDLKILPEPSIAIGD